MKGLAGQEFLSELASPRRRRSGERRPGVRRAGERRNQKRGARSGWGPAQPRDGNKDLRRRRSVEREDAITHHQPTVDGEHLTNDIARRGTAKPGRLSRLERPAAVNRDRCAGDERAKVGTHP